MQKFGPTALIATFGSEHAARRVAAQLHDIGIDPGDVRVDDSLDALASVQGQMRQEADGVVAGPGTGPLTRSASRGLALGTVVGAVVGLVIALPFAAIPMGDLSVGGRLLLVAAVGVTFGSFLGWFLGGAFGFERPEEPLAASQGTTLAVPDSGAARRLLVGSGPTRVDVVSADGALVGRLATEGTTSEGIVGEIARHARNEPRQG